VFVVTQGMLSKFYVGSGYQTQQGYIMGTADLLAALQALTTAQQGLFLLADGTTQAQAITGYKPLVNVPGVSGTVFQLTGSRGQIVGTFGPLSAANLIALLLKLPPGLPTDEPVYVNNGVIFDQVIGVKVIQAFGPAGPPAVDAYVALLTSVRPPRWPYGTGQIQ
jgi:hypothetical protein